MSQIIALTEKNIKIKIRFKATVIISFVLPIISLLMPLIIMTKFFSFNEGLGPWNQRNFFIFVFMAYHLMLLKDIINQFPLSFRQEKYWDTLPALIIAPFNRFNLLLGIFFSHLIIVAIPFAIFFIMCYFIFPIGLITVLFIIALYLLIAILFSGIGLILSILIVSKENYVEVLKLILNIIFWFSCINYPFQIYPKIIQEQIGRNPLYYVFFFLRVSWIENDVIYSITRHPYFFIVLIIGAITLPSIGVIIFNKIYRKFGIVGY